MTDPIIAVPYLFFDFVTAWNLKFGYTFIEAEYFSLSYSINFLLYEKGNQ